MSIKSNSERSGAVGAASQLHYADSKDPDIRYLTGLYMPDPYLLFTKGKRKIGVATANEYNRMSNESLLDEVLLLDEVREQTASRYKLPKATVPDIPQVMRYLAEQYGIGKFKVSSRFSAGLLTELQKAGIEFEINMEDDLLPQRKIKTADELKLLRKANRASAAGFRVVEKALAEAKVAKGILMHEGKVLSSEKLRQDICHACLDEGAIAMDTIVAIGDQSCDSHCAGYGPIRAGELIVVDIYPQRIEDGYWGDMTRTYLKGRANDAQRRLVRTVKQAHKLALDMIKPGVRGGKVHEAIEDFFVSKGYETDKGREAKGFFHALGHAVGLEIHEEPIMRHGAKFRLRKGMVMAVEPGLYYPGLGGARFEDVVHLVPGGCEKISTAPYRWEIA